MLQTCLESQKASQETCAAAGGGHGGRPGIGMLLDLCGTCPKGSMPGTLRHNHGQPGDVHSWYRTRRGPLTKPSAVAVPACNQGLREVLRRPGRNLAFSIPKSEHSP